MEALFSDYDDIRKSGLFDAEYYLVTYPDVAERNIDPLVHYLEDAAEARPAADFDAGFYLNNAGSRRAADNPLCTTPAARAFQDAAREAETLPGPRQRATGQQQAADPGCDQSLGVAGARRNLCCRSAAEWRRPRSKRSPYRSTTRPRVATYNGAARCRQALPDRATSFIAASFSLST
jgi:hypothetical protein